MKLLTFVTLLLLNTVVLANNLPPQNAVPGGLVHIPLQGNATPKVIYRGHAAMVIPSEGTQYQNNYQWVALVGIPLSAKPGDQSVSINGNIHQFSINDKQYREQRITITNKRKVNPNPLDLERIRREKKEILAALASWSVDKDPITKLAKPAQGPYSSPFGLKRFFNDQPRKPHSGLDIAAPKGAPIVSPAPGKVVAKGDYFFNGNTVILDHGHGLTTMYCHMDTISVALNQEVDQGETIGTIGNTGRVTGPHLHWGVSMNNARIDPLLLMQE